MKQPPGRTRGVTINGEEVPAYSVKVGVLIGDATPWWMTSSRDVGMGIRNEETRLQAVVSELEHALRLANQRWSEAKEET